jgi:hypothetical protein
MEADKRQGGKGCSVYEGCSRVMGDRVKRMEGGKGDQPEPGLRHHERNAKSTVEESIRL